MANTSKKARIPYTALIIILATLQLVINARVNAAVPGDNPAYLHNTAGMQSLREGNFARAEECFTRAINRDPGVKYFYNNLSAVYIRTGRYEKALRCLEICTSIDPGYTKALANMSVASFYLYRFYDALGYLRKAIAADSDYTKKRFSREKVLVRIRKISEKNPENRDLKRIIRHLENTPENFNNTGQ